METDATSPISIVAAVNWTTAVLLGPIGTAIAVVAIAALGVAMLRGRLPIARGAVVVLGCFILFSSQTIARGLLAALSTASASVTTTPVDVSPAYTPVPPPPAPYDPYAGASVPVTPPDGARDLLPR